MLHAVNFPDGAMRLIRESGETLVLTPQEVRLIRAQHDRARADDHLRRHTELGQQIVDMRQLGLI